MGEQYDFSGWATRNNLRCSDGRTIRKNAFADCDGKTVPLVWNHQHNDPFNVLGHALLENRDDGVYAYCSLNNTEAGQTAKEYIKHGDVESLSIYANQLKQNGGDVLHGMIREVSLVLAGANPGAFIDSVMMHSDGESSDDEAYIYTGEEIAFAHSDEDEVDESEEDDELDENEEDEDGEELDETEDDQDGSLEHSDGSTIKDVINTMNDEQRKVMYALIGEALASNGEEDSDVNHNAFENDGQDSRAFLSRADQAQIIADGKKYGSLKESFLAHAEALGMDGSSLMHADDDAAYNIERSQDVQDYFVNDPSFLFPEAKSINGAIPQWIKRKTDWVAGVMSGTKHSPMSRIKTTFADITEDEARAKGYIKGNMKKEEVFSLLKRTTTPTTVYKKQKMDRDDVIDITDFDVVSWIRGEMRMMLDEELARAILVGDGRLASSDDKINEQNIRPIWTDHELFAIKKVLTFAPNATEDEKAKAVIKASVKARKDYRGSGNLTLFTTEDWLTDMMLLEDAQGYRLYKTEAELASAMRVSKIVTVPIMENLSRVVDGVTRNLIGIEVNLTDYTVGADKGGQISMFDQFDIDYNQQKYLIETRCCGALAVPYSAIILESVTSAG